VAAERTRKLGPTITVNRCPLQNDECAVPASAFAVDARARARLEQFVHIDARHLDRWQQADDGSASARRTVANTNKRQLPAA